MRRAAKVDANQTAIVRELRAIGVSVWILGKPLDLLICHRGETSVMEVKNPEGKNRYTNDQIDFMAEWPGRIYTVRSPQDAVEQVLARWMG